MSNSEKCHWCTNYGASTWIREINNVKHESVQKFCSRKCKTEYDDRYDITWKKSGCFVATAVYGNYDHPVVLDLRYFRDHFLDQKNGDVPLLNGIILTALIWPILSAKIEY